MFYKLEDSYTENYANNTTPYAFVYGINTVIPALQRSVTKLFMRFDSNHMQANPEKSHLLSSSKTLKNLILVEP